MFGIHIRLHLKDETGHFLFLGRNLTRLGRLHLRFRPVCADPVQQFLDTKGVDGRAEPDRRHRPVQHRLMIKRWQQLLGHLDFFEELFQQMGGDVFGQFRVIQPADFDAFGDLVAVGAVHQFQTVAQDVIGAHEFAAHTNGPGGGGDVDGKVFLNFVNDLKRIAAFAVQLVAEGQDRQIAQPADLKELLRLAFDTFGPVNHHHRRIHGRERAVRVFGKVRVTGCIHQIEAELLKIERHGRGGNGYAPVLFHLHEIGSCAPCLTLCPHLSGHLNGPAIKQEFLGQRRLARIGVRDNRKGPAAGNFGGQFRAICHAR